MGELEESIRRKIKQLALQGIPMSRLCQVTAIDEDKNTITASPVDGGADFINVRLLAVKNGNSGVIIMPELNSYVILGAIGADTHDAFVSSLSAFKWIKVIQDGQVKIELDADGNLMLNGDQFGGLAKMPALKEQLDKNNAILNAILGVINGVEVLEPGNGAASVLQTKLKAAVLGKDLGDFSNLENDKVKHG